LTSPDRLGAITVEETARSYFKCVAERDVDGMMDHWRPGGRGHIHGIADLVAPDSYSAWFNALFAAFPDFRFEVDSVTADEERAAVHWTVRGTFNGTGSFEGLDPTGASVEISGIDLLTVEDGKLVELHAHMNGMEMARQLGALPSAGSAPERAMFGALNLKTRIADELRRHRG
jgi:predicted ester cyclase